MWLSHLFSLLKSGSVPRLFFFSFFHAIDIALRIQASRFAECPQLGFLLLCICD